MTQKQQQRIGLILVFILLAAGGYIVWTRLGPTEPTYRDHSEEAPGQGVVGVSGRDEDPFDVQIEYTNDGYATTSVVVKKGTRVRFLNASGVQTWPASGIHPTHTLYPEKQSTDCLGSSFDSCTSLETGEYFDYTFNYVGTWSFHDHLHGYHSGRIIVE